MGSRGALIAGLDGPSSHKPSVTPAHHRTSFYRRAQSSGTSQWEVDPAAGSSNGIPPPKTVICRQARRSLTRRHAPGDTRHHPTADHTGIALVDTTSNQPLLND